MHYNGGFVRRYVRLSYVSWFQPAPPPTMLRTVPVEGRQLSTMHLPLSTLLRAALPRLTPNCFPYHPQATPKRSPIFKRFPNVPNCFSNAFALKHMPFSRWFSDSHQFFLRSTIAAQRRRRKERAAAMKNTNYHLLTLMWISVDRRRLVFPFARSRAVSTQKPCQGEPMFAGFIVRWFHCSLVSLFAVSCSGFVSFGACAACPAQDYLQGKSEAGARFVPPNVAPRRVISMSFLSHPMSFLSRFYVVSIPFPCASGHENIEKTGRIRRLARREKISPPKAEYLVRP